MHAAGAGSLDIDPGKAEYTVDDTPMGIDVFDLIKGNTGSVDVQDAVFFPERGFGDFKGIMSIRNHGCRDVRDNVEREPRSAADEKPPVVRIPTDCKADRKQQQQDAGFRSISNKKQQLAVRV